MLPANPAATILAFAGPLRTRPNIGPNGSCSTIPLARKKIPTATMEGAAASHTASGAITTNNGTAVRNASVSAFQPRRATTGSRIDAAAAPAPR
jgi:hypothetical protein